MAKLDVVINSLHRKMIEDDICVVQTGDGSLPDLLILDEKYGFAAIIVIADDEYLDEERLQEFANSRLRNLRAELLDILESSDKPRLIVIRSDSAKQNGYIDVPMGFLQTLEAPALALELREKVLERFNPRYSFSRKKRLSLDDRFRDNREKLRVNLQDEQRVFVDYPPKEVFWITGPPGSGKSLVLMARAIRMSRLFPEYAISFITFNQSLKRYFADELSQYPNILVETFGDFSRRRDDKFHFYYKRGGQKQSVSFNQTETEYLRAKQKGIVRDVDAIFIDEVQDFFPAWLRYCVECQTLDGGGVTIAGDVTQAIYRENDIPSVVELYDFEKVELPVSYRSTQEILTVVQWLTGIEHKLELSPHGLKPDLVYVDSDSRINAVNDALIRDLVDLLKHHGVRERDIGILVTRNYQRYRLREELETRLKAAFKFDIKVAAIEKGAADMLNLEEDSIKLTTVHNAKGLEFSVVFLLGLDDLSDDEEDEPMLKKGERLVLVGPTRARDRLFIYYAKQNIYLRRLSDHPESVTFRSYPEDYERGAD